MFNYSKFFYNKVGIVTGGGSGIGLDTSIKLANFGAKVYATYRKENKEIKKIKNFNFKKNGKIIFIKLKSIEEKNIKELLIKIRKKDKLVQFLVNNIGNAINRSKFIKSNENLWKSNFEINLFSNLRFTKHFLNLFTHKKTSSIVNVGSIAGKTGGYGDSTHYAASKAAVHALTKGLAREIKGVRVNCVAPSVIDTPFQKRLSSKTRLRNIIKKTPLQRIGKVDEVSNTIVFLVSNYSSYVNGEVIFVSGGRN